MANLSEDIQCAGSDTRPPMLDRIDFALWQQRIRLYCRGKESEVNILKSIDEGPYQIGTVREPFAEGTKEDLATNILLQGLPKDIYTPINHYTDAKDIWDNVKMLLEGSELTKEDQESQLGLRDSNYDQLYAYLKQHEIHAKENKMMLERFSQHIVDPLALMTNVSNPQRHIARNCTQPKRPQNSEYCKDKMLLMQAQENGVAFDAEQLLFLAGGQDNAIDDDVDEQPVQDLAINVDNVFHAEECDAFDSDVDETPTAQTMFMANLSFTDPVTDEAGPSYDSNILSEQVQPALYSGHEIIKDNHAPAIVHNTEETLEIAEITRKKMNAKMKDPECVTRKVKIAPHDYSKENFLATFTTQKQLTLEQIFWSQDLIKLKSEALK
nr:retrovirus-related Pol polyprotein from transposon TNT 1-94 [Tanacetum cinerariifolium]